MNNHHPSLSKPALSYSNTEQNIDTVRQATQWLHGRIAFPQDTLDIKSGER